MVPCALMHMVDGSLGDYSGETLAGSPAYMVNPATICIRSGYSEGDVLCCASIGRVEMGHLHHDAGSVTISKGGHLFITDPGCQQYFGVYERDYTLGATAHNAPVIDGKIQCVRAARILEESAAGADLSMSVLIDLSECYGFTGDKRVTRLITFDGRNARVTLEDSFEGCAGSEISYYFDLGANAAVSLESGVVSAHIGDDGLYISGRADDKEILFDSRGMDRHVGSRGPNYCSAKIGLDGDSHLITWELEFR